MKIVLTTTLLVAVLAIGIFVINNSFAQNDTISMGNSSVMNAILPMTLILLTQLIKHLILVN